ncbi:MAG: acyltransferase family protein [Anaerolineaceae bacterium]
MTPVPKAPPGARQGHLPHLPGLDGLRAIAVLAVVFYHAGAGWCGGGYLGVETFFVISGYLITSLLLLEREREGCTGFRAFWLRRARRLLPALAVVVLACLGYAVVFLPTEVAGLRTDALAAAGYATNWYLIFEQRSYFESLGRPSALQHLWSLAVEEQYYLAWPLLFAGMMRIWRPRVVLAITLGGALASALLMALLFSPEADPSRIYYGTDTRAVGLLLGSAMALCWRPWLRPARAERLAVGFSLDVGGLAALALLAVLFLRLPETSAFLYRGGFVLSGAAAALVIAVAVHPDAHVVPQILGVRPLRWLGTRSYAVYLWHWPVITVTRPGLDTPLDGLALFALRLGVTLVLAELSYRLVETPVRNGALGRAWRSLRSANGIGRAYHQAGWAGAGLLLVALTVSVAGAEAAETPDYLRVESVHLKFATPDPSHAEPVSESVTSPSPAIEASPPRLVEPAPTSEATPTAAPTVEPTAAVTVLSVSSAPPRPAELPAPPPPRAPQLPAGTRVLAIGDSVMLGAAYQLGATLGSVEIDAAVGRQSASAISVLNAYRAGGGLPSVVIIDIGNNGTLTPGQIDSVMEALAGVAKVIFVTVRVDRPWEEGNNANIWDARGRHPNIFIADWHAASTGHPEYFQGDGIHLRQEGAQAFADLLGGSAAA